MATLFRRKNIWYINYSVNGQRFKVSTGTSNKKHAQFVTGRVKQYQLESRKRNDTNDIIQNKLNDTDIV